MLHTRLSIIDLKNRSNQPYKYKNLVMVFNGEIYNFIELKKELISRKYHFKTKSDTEVLLKCYHCFGEMAFDKFEGMWSLAIYDLSKNSIVISRDRFGEKRYIPKKKKTVFILPQKQNSYKVCAKII